MTDRELLELAAKAAGIGVEWKEVIRSRMAEFKSIKHTKHCGFFADGKEWNPLTNDGDAFRLAVKLGLGISISLRNKRTDVVTFSGPLISVIEAHGDPLAATRRAIVRAAAEIGRNMK